MKQVPENEPAFFVQNFPEKCDLNYQIIFCIHL